MFRRGTKVRLLSMSFGPGPFGGVYIWVDWGLWLEVAADIGWVLLIKSQYCHPHHLSPRLPKLIQLSPPALQLLPSYCICILPFNIEPSCRPLFCRQALIPHCGSRVQNNIKIFFLFVGSSLPIWGVVLADGCRGARSPR